MISHGLIRSTARYCNETDFMPLNIDILLHQNLIDSLENYVKGDLLEGDNAYTCEKCNKKVCGWFVIYHGSISPVL